jgi:hypothetical protein
MFFRRPQHKEPTFEERLNQVRRAGFLVEPLPGGRRYRIRRGECATILEISENGEPRIVQRVGILMGDEIGVLVDGGFQKFFLTPSGRRRPALAEDLRALHDFEEDLKEALGQVSLYNESLGTVSTLYLYDRVKDRDRGTPKRPWEE